MGATGNMYFYSNKSANDALVGSLAAFIKKFGYYPKRVAVHVDEKPKFEQIADDCSIELIADNGVLSKYLILFDVVPVDKRQARKLTTTRKPVTRSK